MNPFDKDVLTTGEVAKICNVAARTVSKWFDSGQIEGYRIPGSKDRRIPVQSLMTFMQEHGIPFEANELPQPYDAFQGDGTSFVSRVATALCRIRHSLPLRKIGRADRPDTCAFAHSR